MTVLSESRRGTAISLVCVHSNEGNHPAGLLDDRTAENLADYLRRECAAGRGKSYHKIVDNDSTVTLVSDSQAAWSAKGANTRSLNICLIGWAAWTRPQWLAHTPMLVRAAKEIREWSKLHNVPLVRLTPAQVRARERGVIGHVDWSHADLDDSDHTDPGPNFPWDIVLGLAANPGQALSGKRKPVSIELEPTVRKIGSDKPGPDWPTIERVIFTNGAVKVVFGNDGGWIARAWWGERGQDIVPENRPVAIEQFKIQRWMAPPWAEYVTIRYAAPAGGVILPSY